MSNMSRRYPVWPGFRSPPDQCMIEQTLESWQQTDSSEVRVHFHLGPECARVFTDLSAEQKDKYKADIRATNILLQELWFKMSVEDTMRIIKEDHFRGTMHEEMLVSGNAVGSEQGGNENPDQAKPIKLLQL
ncbi:hypothetical protein Tco_1070548 [Tanacetum coccineum]|uniref:Uncharacterized protein n=1 Tax=Tanacetum coccineum TaxID=301880 RepID=A0ABQ5HLQ3_9ASTR